MKDFKEWLSDNLRYFMLGFFVILVLVLAFLGIRFLSGQQDSKPIEVPITQEVAIETPEPQKEESSEAVVTPVPTESVPTDLLEKNAYPQVNAVIQQYYKALSEKDVEGIKAVVDELDPAEAAKITNDQYLDGYSNVEVYTKDGLTEGEYVVFASYNYKFKDIDKLVPGLSQLYVQVGEDDSLYIAMQEQDDSAKEHITQTIAEADVQELIQSVKGEYDKAQEEDESLRNFIANLGIASSKAVTAENGSTVTVKSECNVRSIADVSGEVITQLSPGTQVVKIGTEGEWIQISFEDQTGYVRSDLFE